MSQKICHSGIVERIDDGCVHVRIVQTSACAACKVAGYCNAAESKEKIIDVKKKKTKNTIIKLQFSLSIKVLFFMTELRLCCCTQAFSSCSEQEFLSSCSA